MVVICLANIHPIKNGTIENPEELGVVMLTRYGLAGSYCTGTLISNSWVLTGNHCFNENDKRNPKGSGVEVQLGSQRRISAQLLLSNPGGGTGYLVRLEEPLLMNGSKSGFRRAVFRDNYEMLVGQSLKTYGYAGSSVLRSGNFIGYKGEGRCQDDCINLKSTTGQEVENGDSGGPTFLNSLNQESMLAAITWGSGDVTTTSMHYGWLWHNINKDYFGNVMASGDFNNDRYNDLAVGISGDPVTFNNKTVYSAGSVAIFYGSENGFQFVKKITQSEFEVNESCDLFGYSLAVGDYNNDGIDDLAVGAPGETTIQDIKSGAVYLFRGSSQGLQYVAMLDESGIGTHEPGELFGFSLTSGDFNGDHIDDLAISAPRESTLKSGNGAVFLFKGQNNALKPWHYIDGRELHEIEPADYFGYSITCLDFNNDGIDDLAVGAPGHPVSNIGCGTAYVFKGTYDKLKPWQELSQTSISGGINDHSELFGWCLAAGDYNGDGNDDLAIGAPRAKAKDLGSLRVGAVFMFKGTERMIIDLDGGLTGWYFIDQQEIGSRESNDWFGGSLTSGNFNNDQYDDLIIGSPGEAPGESQAGGYVVIFIGSSQQLIYLSGLEQRDKCFSENGDWFGGSLAIYKANKANAKRILLVGAPGEILTTNNYQGVIYCYENYPSQTWSQMLYQHN